MTNETKPYISRDAGDLITAEDWNAVQIEIQEDMQSQIESAKEEIKKTGVERADNADKFDKKTPKGWTDELDGRYAPKVHDHEGWAVYRRYFKRLRADQKIVLKHELGRFPLVDVYELLPITSVDGDGNAQTSMFYLHYHHEERDRDVLYTEDRGMVRWAWGAPLEQLLREYEVKWDDDDSLGDVVNDFLDAFFKPPVVDHMTHRTSTWIDAHRENVIAELKRRDEWPDIRWVVRPHKLIVGSPVYVSTIEDEVVTLTPLVNVAHLSYDTLEVTAADPLTDAEGNPIEAIDLMILLRS